MVFHADTAFALILIALGVGFWVLVKARSQEDGNLKGFGTILGYFIVVLSFLVLLCAGYYSVRYWEDGYFASRPAKEAVVGPMGMHRAGPGMMGHMGMSGQGYGMMMNTYPSGTPGQMGQWQYPPWCGQKRKTNMMPDDTSKTMNKHMQGMMHDGHVMENEQQPE
jgi:hypothetical protein